MSTALVLVNRVLNTTGDYQDLTSIDGAPVDIGTRILNFLNTTIAEVELITNWPVLRQDLTATTRGDTVYTYLDTYDIRTEGPVSVWLDGDKQLEELAAEQFDKIKARDGTSGTPRYFQRRVGAGKQLSIEILGTVAAGGTLNVSAYRRATRLTTDSSTTEFDDDILVLGAIMRMDAYDGLDRGYAGLYKNMHGALVNSKFKNSHYRISVESYA